MQYQWIFNWFFNCYLLCLILQIHTLFTWLNDLIPNQNSSTNICQMFALSVYIFPNQIILNKVLSFISVGEPNLFSNYLTSCSQKYTWDLQTKIISRYWYLYFKKELKLKGIDICCNFRIPHSEHLMQQNSYFYEPSTLLTVWTSQENPAFNFQRKRTMTRINFKHLKHKHSHFYLLTYKYRNTWK